MIIIIIIISKEKRNNEMILCFINKRIGGPGGCVRSTSKVKPTAEEKAKFEKLVEEIKSIAQQHAIKSVQS